MRHATRRIFGARTESPGLSHEAWLRCIWMSLRYSSRQLLHRQLLLSDRLLQFPDCIVPRPQWCCQWWWILRWWILELDSRPTEGDILAGLGEGVDWIRAPGVWSLCYWPLFAIQWLKLLRWERGQAWGLWVEMKGHHNKASSQEFSVDLACYSSQIRLGFRHRWDEHLRLLVRPCQFQPRLIHILLQSATRSSFQS